LEEGKLPHQMIYNFTGWIRLIKGIFTSKDFYSGGNHAAILSIARYITEEFLHKKNCCYKMYSSSFHYLLTVFIAY